MYRPATLHVLLAVLVCLLIALAIILPRVDRFADLGKTLQVTSIGSGMLDYGTMGDILKRLGLVTIDANDFERFKPTDHADDEFETMLFQKKRQVGDYLYTAHPGGPAAYQSSEVLQDVETKPGWPIISIVIDERFLHDPETGIMHMNNRNRKGQAWEKVAQVSYLEDGQVRFETHAGLRMHGGKRLTTGEFKPGFRLYFRGKYGLEAVPDRLILPDIDVPLRTVVLQTSAWPPGYPLNNPVAYDIARRVGAQAPTTRLVDIYVNGKPYSKGFATEHLSHRQWGQRYGDSDYFFVKYRSRNTARDLVDYRQKINHLLRDSTPLTVENMSEALDLDNLTAQFVAWGFCGTGDYCQGVAVAERNNPESTLSWVTWDMDHSFWDGSAISYGIDRKHWQQPAFVGYLNLRDGRRFCWRQDLFSRLIDQDEAYRSRFITRVVEVLNHLINPPFLAARLAYYRQMLSNYGQPHAEYMAMLTDFMTHRPSFVREELRESFSLSGPFSCRISVPDDVEISVDGHRYRGGYEGSYFRETPLTLEIVGNTPETGRAHWLVNGRTVPDAQLQLILEEDTTITLVLP